MAISLELMPLEEKLPEAPPAKTMVVRYGFLKEIGEFHSDVTSKVGCGTKLVIRTDRGTEIAEMLTTTCGNGGCNKSITREKMLEYIDLSGGRDYPFSEQGRILRVATSQDLLEQSKLDENHHKHLHMARDLVATHKLSMKIVDVEHLLGGERIMFYFVSEQRIDFRGLVRDLAQGLHTRIELRQVGARDEARLTADYEKCGQHCCCKQFLKVLTPISMRSAKVQKATLDPTKISGRCGRLMCCLRYEDQTYEELRKKLPKRNTRVATEKGDAWVIDGQILTQLVLCQFDDGKREAIPMEKISAFDRPKPVMSDGRVMQTPNDRPPPMMQGEMPGRRGPGGPGGPRQPGPATPPPMRRPMPGAPAAGVGGDPLAVSGPTGGDLSASPAPSPVGGGPVDEIDDLLADALDGAVPPRTGAGGAGAAAPGGGEGGSSAGVDDFIDAPGQMNDPRAFTSRPPEPAKAPFQQHAQQRTGQQQNRPPQNRPGQQQPPRGPRGPQNQGQRGPGGQGGAGAGQGRGPQQGQPGQPGRGPQGRNQGGRPGQGQNRPGQGPRVPGRAGGAGEAGPGSAASGSEASQSPAQGPAAPPAAPSAAPENPQTPPSS